MPRRRLCLRPRRAAARKRYRPFSPCTALHISLSLLPRTALTAHLLLYHCPLTAIPLPSHCPCIPSPHPTTAIRRLRRRWSPRSLLQRKRLSNRQVTRAPARRRSPHLAIPLAISCHRPLTTRFTALPYSPKSSHSSLATIITIVTLIFLMQAPKKKVVAKKPVAKKKAVSSSEGNSFSTHLTTYYTVLLLHFVAKKPVAKKKAVSSSEGATLQCCYDAVRLCCSVVTVFLHCCYAQFQHACTALTTLAL